MMRPVLKIILSLSLLLGGMFPALAQSSLQQLIADLQSGQFDSANTRFSPSVKAMLSPALLQNSWEQLQVGLGSFESLGAISTSEQDGVLVEESVASFSKGAMRVVASTGQDGVLAFRFFPMNYRLPSYGRSVAVGKLNLQVKARDSLPLEGELILPKGCDGCPVVVLVHGSGPNDMDETIGPNKPFKDIALGLAEQGIGSFRYHKRSHVYPQEFSGGYTLQELVVDDAVAAVRLLAGREDLPLGPIFVAGHSLGGYALPRILERAGEQASGGIVLAGPSRSMSEVILDQARYFAAMDSVESEEERAAIQIAAERVDRIRRLDFSDSTPWTELMGMWPGTLWRDVANYDPPAVVASLQLPLLVLQGAKDCQVYETDFMGWQAAGGPERVKLISYPGLNHLFMHTEATWSHPSEYQIQGNVAHQVILDMVQWIEAQETQR